MTVYALRLENGTDTAARVRKADALGLAPSGNVSARGGIRPGPDAAVVAVTAGTMQVTVQPFLAFVDGGISDAQGGYPFVSDAVETLTLADGHGTLSRTDVIAAVVRDSAFDSSGALEAAVEVVQGTPGAGVPALPTNAVALRNVVVPAGASAGTGGLSSGALSTDRRTWLSGLGGVLPVASQTERDALPAVVPTVVYRTDTDQLEVRKAGGWESLTPGGWTTVSAFVGGWTNYGDGFQDAAYRKVGDRVELRGSVKSGPLGGVVFTLPAGFRPSGYVQAATVGGAAFAFVEVQPDGDVIAAGPSGANTLFSLNVSFSTL